MTPKNRISFMDDPKGPMKETRAYQETTKDYCTYIFFNNTNHLYGIYVISICLRQKSVASKYFNS